MHSARQPCALGVGCCRWSAKLRGSRLNRLTQRIQAPLLSRCNSNTSNSNNHQQPSPENRPNRTNHPDHFAAKLRQIF